MCLYNLKFFKTMAKTDYDYNLITKNIFIVGSSYVSTVVRYHCCFQPLNLVNTTVQL